MSANQSTHIRNWTDENTFKHFVLASGYRYYPDRKKSPLVIDGVQLCYHTEIGAKVMRDMKAFDDIAKKCDDLDGVKAKLPATAHIAGSKAKTFPGIKSTPAMVQKQKELADTKKRHNDLVAEITSKFAAAAASADDNVRFALKCALLRIHTRNVRYHAKQHINSGHDVPIWEIMEHIKHLLKSVAKVARRVPRVPFVTVVLNKFMIYEKIRKRLEQYSAKSRNAEQAHRKREADTNQISNMLFVGKVASGSNKQDKAYVREQESIYLNPNASKLEERKRQAPSPKKRQAPSPKRQAPSAERRAPSPKRRRVSAAVVVIGGARPAPSRP